MDTLDDGRRPADPPRGVTPLVPRARVPQGAYARSVADGALVPVTPLAAAPADVPWGAGVRAVALSPVVPQGAAATGMAALWVVGWEHPREAPWPITVAVRRGAHPDPPLAAGAGWRYLTDNDAVASAASIAGTLVCSAPAAIAAALAWEPLPDALAASWWALATGLADPAAVPARLARVGNVAARRRGRAAWEALSGALMAA